MLQIPEVEKYKKKDQFLKVQDKQIRRQMPKSLHALIEIKKKRGQEQRWFSEMAEVES